MRRAALDRVETGNTYKIDSTAGWFDPIRTGISVKEVS